uniref:SH3 domain-containing protein n=1 Tax=Panagrolaimus davidi TaxID=227884 RepID=A0A914PX81_9BILA
MFHDEEASIHHFLNNIPQPSYREVKALYDFEAAEENELNMKVGDSVMVFEDSDANGWKGQSHGDVGLFPSSFVTGDLTDNNAVDYTNGTVDTPLEEPQNIFYQSLNFEISLNF